MHKRLKDEIERLVNRACSDAYIQARAYGMRDKDTSLEDIDKAIREAREKPLPVIKHCDQCDWMVVNGLFIHEQGCPNQFKTWNGEEGKWVAFLHCEYCDDDYPEDFEHLH